MYSVAKFLLDFKEKVVVFYCEELTAKIKTAQATASDEEMTALLIELTRYNNIRRVLAKSSGEKTVIKL